MSQGLNGFFSDENITLGTRGPLGELRSQAGWLMVLGLTLMVLGFVTINHSISSTLITMVFVGWLVIFAGVAQLVQAFRSGKVGLFFLHLLVSILYVVVGFLLISNPGASALSLTLLMAGIFLVSGIFKVCAAIALRGPGAGWLALNGVVTFILGLVVHHQWPVSGLWVIGTFLGVDFVMSGVHLFVLGLGARKIIPKHA